MPCSSSSAGGGQHGGGVEVAGGLALRRPQGAAQAEGALALGRGEVRVAGGEGEAVRVAHGGTDLDPHGDVEVTHQPADDERLLGVLLPEVGDVGGGHVEQLGHHGRDAGEVLGAALLGGAVEHAGQAGDGHGRGEAGG